MDEITKKTQKYLQAIGKEVFISILYLALKRKFEIEDTYDIDYLEVCRAYPEYAEHAESDKSKRTRLSKAKSILRNGWEREALTLIAESSRIDEKLIKIANEYLWGRGGNRMDVTEWFVKA